MIQSTTHFRVSANCFQPESKQFEPKVNKIWTFPHTLGLCSKKAEFKVKRVKSYCNFVFPPSSHKSSSPKGELREFREN